MLLVVLNDEQASGIKAKNAKEHAAKAQPESGEIRITKIQKDGNYVVIFDNHLRGYSFGGWLKDHNVKHEVVEVSDNAMLGEKLVRLLPDLAAGLAAKEAGGPGDSKARLKREETIQKLVNSIMAPGK